MRVSVSETGGQTFRVASDLDTDSITVDRLQTKLTSFGCGQRHHRVLRIPVV